MTRAARHLPVIVKTGGFPLLRLLFQLAAMKLLAAFVASWNAGQLEAVEQLSAMCAAAASAAELAVAWSFCLAE